MNPQKDNDLRSGIISLDHQALAYLDKTGSASVTEVYDALRVRNPSLSRGDVADLVSRLAGGENVSLEDVPPATSSLGEYLRIWDRNLWFYSSVAVSLMTMMMVYAVPSEFPLVALRWVFGSVFVLFVPGYLTVEALFPKERELDGIERFALSVGLSLALVPLIGLLLNYTPWGIRLTPIIMSLVAFSIGMALVAVARRFKDSLAMPRSRSLS